jgi:hypothetical protein
MTPTSFDRRLSSIGVSVGVLLLAFFVFLRAGEFQSFGPLDLDTADRLALALWVAAPIAGGLLARRAPNGGLIRTALGVGIPVALVVGALTGSGTGQYTCWLSLPAMPMLLGRVVVGGLTGLGMVIGFVATGVATRRGITAVPGVVLAGRCQPRRLCDRLRALLWRRAVSAITKHPAAVPRHLAQMRTWRSLLLGAVLLVAACAGSSFSPPPVSAAPDVVLRAYLQALVRAASGPVR